MLEKKQLDLFLNKNCKIILSNGFSYSGILKEVSETTIVFEDRFEGLKIFDLNIISGIGQTGGKHGRME